MANETYSRQRASHWPRPMNKVENCEDGNHICVKVWRAERSRKRCCSTGSQRYLPMPEHEVPSQQSWNTKIGGVDVLGVLMKRRGAVVRHLHQLRDFELLCKYARNSGQIRTQFRSKNPPRREIRCFGEPPCGLRDSTWRLLAK